MRQHLKQIIKRWPIYVPLRNFLTKIREVLWYINGRPVPPPPSIKQRTLKHFAEQFQLRILVETGTFFGDMVEAMKEQVDQIYSVELSRKLHEKARDRFKHLQHIELICDDSGSVLRDIVRRLERPALFWLDGHYSEGVTAKGEKETPIFEELDCILSAPDLGHVIIIDDARCFGTDPAYPTIAELVESVTSRRPNVDISIRDDSIRIIPSKVPFGSRTASSSSAIEPASRLPRGASVLFVNKRKRVEFFERDRYRISGLGGRCGCNAGCTA